MAGSLIGALRVSLSAETSQFEQGMRRSQQTAARTAGSIKTSMGGATAYIKSSLAGIAAALTAGTLLRAGKDALEYAAHLGELADTLGLTTKDLQTFSYAAGQVGISQDELESGIQKLTISMGKAQVGSQAQVKAFESIGISIDQLKGKDAGEVFRLIADRLEGVSDRSKRAAVEVALFGKAGAKLDNLLSGSQGRLEDLTKAAQELGIVLSDKQIQQADRTADKIAALQTVLKAKIAGVVADNADSIYDFASSLADLAGEIAKAIAELTRLANWINQNGAPIQNFFRSMTPQHGLLEYGGAAFGALRSGKNPIDAINAVSGQGRSKGDIWKQIMAGNADFLSQGRHAAPVSVGNFLAGAGPKAKKDHSAEELQRKQLDALRKQYEMAQDALQADADILEAKKDLSGNYSEQASLQIALLDNARQQFQLDLAYQVKQNEITKGADGITQAQADQKQAQYDIADSLKRQKVIQDEAEQRERDVQELTQHDFERRRNILEAQDGIATTAKERRQIELQLLDLAYEAKRQALQDIIDHSKDEKAKEDARRDLINLKATYGADRQRTLDQTMNPFEEWAKSVPKTSQEIIESLQSIEVKGLDSLSEALTGVLMGTESLKDAFHSVAASILADLLQMTIKMLLFKAITSAFGGQGSTSGFAGGGSINVGNTPGFATGGSITVGGRSGTDKNMLSLNGIPIARVSYGERINIANDDTPMGMPSVSLAFHNDFRGADPAAVAAIQARLDRMQAELPSTVVATMKDARDRFVWRGR